MTTLITTQFQELCKYNICGPHTSAHLIWPRRMYHERGSRNAAKNMYSKPLVGPLFRLEPQSGHFLVCFLSCGNTVSAVLDFPLELVQVGLLGCALSRQTKKQAHGNASSAWKLTVAQMPSGHGKKGGILFWLVDFKFPISFPQCNPEKGTHRKTKRTHDEGRNGVPSKTQQPSNQSRL